MKKVYVLIGVLVVVTIIVALTCKDSALKLSGVSKQFNYVANLSDTKKIYAKYDNVTYNNKSVADAIKKNKKLVDELVKEAKYSETIADSESKVYTAVDGDNQDYYIVLCNVEKNNKKVEDVYLFADYEDVIETCK